VEGEYVGLILTFESDPCPVWVAAAAAAPPAQARAATAAAAIAIPTIAPAAKPPARAPILSLQSNFSISQPPV